jgi:hypothetical protein
MLIHMQGILALTKHGMMKQKSSRAETELADLCLICEKQASLIARLLALRENKLREEKDQFDMVLEYAELWDKNRRGRTTPYEQRKVASMSAEFDADERNAIILGREAEIGETVSELKALVNEFRAAGRALRPAGI